MTQFLSAWGPAQSRLGLIAVGENGNPGSSVRRHEYSRTQVFVILGSRMYRSLACALPGCLPRRKRG